MAAKPLTPDQLLDAQRLKQAFDLFNENIAKMSQEKLADLCGWKTQGTVHQYMNGKIPLNPVALVRFCKALKTNPESISPALAELIVDFDNEVFVSSASPKTGVLKAKAALKTSIPDAFAMEPVGGYEVNRNLPENVQKTVDLMLGEDVPMQVAIFESAKLLVKVKNLQKKSF